MVLKLGIDTIMNNYMIDNQIHIIDMVFYLIYNDLMQIGKLHNQLLFHNPRW